MPFLGAHMSVAGGLHLALERMQRAGAESLQIFTRNQRQWRASSLTAEEIALFKRAWQEADQPLVAAHDSYLINLASPKPEIAAKSIAALADELDRCAALAIPWLVMHPGAHLGAGPEQGLSRVADNLDLALERAAGAQGVMVLLETTAGQGTSLGASFGELAAIIEQSRHGARLGVCFDTCHVFAAGYDLRTPESYAATFAEFDRVVCLDRLRFFHLNDSVGQLGSRVDRHAHIGQGAIGCPGFALLVNDPCFAGHPMTLETPKGKDLKEDIENLALLRSLQKQGDGGSA